MARSDIVLAAVGLIALGAIACWATGGFTAKAEASGQYASFAQCLTDSGAAMYGAYWCPHCQSQKLAFGDAWPNVRYVECDPRGPEPQATLCEQEGITGYPTWIIDGQKHEGEQSFSSPAAATGCTLPA